MDSKGYYKTLGITEEEQNLPYDKFREICKKKYKALCLKWHPDRWATSTEEEKKKAEDEFKKIAEAYGVLSDENKKRQYDSGMDSGSFDGGGFNPFDIFNHAAGGGFGDFFRDFSGFGGGQRRGRKGEDVDAFVTITFSESISGVKKDVEVHRSVPCPDCHGTGSEDGQEHKCPNCNGTGMEQRSERRGNAYTIYQSPCSHCNGTGKQIEHPCKKCGGTGLVNKNEYMNLNIPGGVRDGMSIAYTGMGDAGTDGGPNGNLVLHVKVSQESGNYFQTQDNDLNIYHEEKVDFIDAILGTKIRVKCPDGKDWEIRLKECTQPGEHFIKSGSGYSHPRNNYVKGDYIVIINYKVPRSLTKEQKKALENYKNIK